VTDRRFHFPPPPIPAIPIAQSDLFFAVRRIYCVGRNYAEHVVEMGGDTRAAPFFFQKPADAIVLNGGSVEYPSITEDFQHEIELVLAIGKAGRDIELDQAHSHVFGLAVGIDLTRRDVQVDARKAGRPWEIGKSFDHSAPVSDIHSLASNALPAFGELTLNVNGRTRQKADLSEMIWRPSEIITRLSRQFKLECGDLIFTGTPAGVSSLSPGDRLEARIEGIDTLRISIAERRQI
jgi:fumarylpyruvate hydrolase